MIKTLINQESYDLPSKIKTILDSYQYSFNPSYVTLNNHNYLAIRVYDKSIDTILALVFIWKNENHIEILDLSAYFKLKLGIDKVADPKLFIMNDKIYGSINTGREIGKQNRLVLLSINTSQISSYHCCEYDKRTAIEKNWAFYTERNQLFALYGLNPLTIIQASHTEAHKIEFEDSFIDHKQNFENFSIGTPFVKLDTGYGFIAHKKITINGNRLYLGKPITLNLNKKPALLSKPKFFIHSFSSLLGNRFKFNKQLISCTYFSGLFNDNKKLIISYGINDVSHNIVMLDQKKIWQ